MDPDAVDAFAAQPLATQLEQLRGRRETSDPRELLELCAGLRDPAPLAWLGGALLADGWLSDPEAQHWFAGFLIARSETAVHKLLKALAEVLARDPELGPAYGATLLAALEAVPLSKLSSMCLIDRALKHNLPEARDAHVQRVEARCVALLEAGDLDALSPDLLAQASARALPALERAAAAGGVAEGFHRLRARLASEAITVLEAAPKAVSQANAEELLSRRVYTDPGHFLIELLQNAEDSGARRWRVVFDATRILVWHDGTPFDVRDLVGVTSIGQTTKRKSQIGFFGVGFKAVYEVTDRPQVYSDVYRFEIADVSVPKELGARPRDVPQEGTLLVLPLRRGLAADAPADLYARACALDPCVLLCLPVIEEIELELTAAAAGGPRRHAVREVDPTPARCLLVQEPDGQRWTYLLERAEHRFAAAREVGRADRTEVLVGVLADDAGVPRALPPSSATLYSYLPTGQTTGLRFFVQAHFDVPVDRERVAPESAWNRWVLGHVPAQLAAIAARVVARGPEAATGLLDVLPLPEELAGELLRFLCPALREVLADVPLLPGADGALHPPRAVAIPGDPALPRAFAGCTLPPGLARDGRRALLDPALPERARRLAEVLGCPTFDGAELVEALERGLAAHPRGEPLPHVERLEVLHDLLLAHVEEREREGADPEAILTRLRALPLVPQESGGTHPLDDRAPVSASLEVRAVYVASPRRFLPEGCDPACEAGGRAGAFLERLGVRRWTAAFLIGELEQLLGSLPSPLADAAAAPLPGSDAALANLHALLGGVSRELLGRAARLPLFRAGDGRLYPVAREEQDVEGVLRRPDVPGLLALYGDARPLLTEDPLQAELLAHLGAPTLELQVLAEDLAREPPLFPLGDPAFLERLHALLEEAREDLSSRVRRKLAKLAVWLDREGKVGALRGDDAVRIPTQPAIVTLFPQARFLHPRLLARRHVATLDVDPIGVERVITALSPRAREPFRIADEPGAIRAALEVVLEHGDAVGKKGRERLATYPLFLDDRERILPLAELALSKLPGLPAVARPLEARAFLEPDGLSLRVIDAFGLRGELREVGLDELVEDLAAADPRGAPFTVPAWVDALLRFVVEHAGRLSRDALLRLLELPLFPDASGQPGPLGELRKPTFPVRVHACAPEIADALDALGLRPLRADLRSKLAPLLVAAGRELPGPLQLLEALVEAPRPLPDSAAEPLQALLVEHHEAWRERFPPEARQGSTPANRALASLRIWRTLSGARVSAAELVAPGAEDLCALGTAAGEALRALSAAPADAERLRRLAPELVARPAARFLAERIQLEATPGAALASQPPLLGSVAAVAACAELLLEHLVRYPDVGEPWFPVVDAAGCLRLDPEALRGGGATLRALVAGTSAAARLAHPELLDHGGERLLRWAEGLRAFSPGEALAALELADDSRPPTPAAEHPLLQDPARRAVLYRWLVDDRARVFSDPGTRATLTQARFVLGQRGELLSPRELVLELDLPDLEGLEELGTPATEVPAATLDVLRRQLDVGRPDLGELVERHLGRAYRARVAAQDGPGAAAILGYLARRDDEPGSPDVATLLRNSGRVLLEDDHGEFRPPGDLILPLDALAPALREVWGDGLAVPHRERFPRGERTLLRLLERLGVERVPSVRLLRHALDQPLTPAAALGLATILGELHSSHPERVAALPLNECAWVLDRSRTPRRPDELFVARPDVTSLVGTPAELLVLREAYERLGIELARALPFRRADSVTLPEVVAHLDARAAADARVPFAVYSWLERGLSTGALDAPSLRRALGARAWVCDDDGRFFPAQRVLGGHALHLFGQRRGYWTLGRERCPLLCATFEIPGAVTVEVLLGFLEEVGEQVEARGEAEVLAADPGLPRLLLACYAELGRRDPDPATVRARLESLPLLLAHERGPGSQRETPRLVCPQDPLLFRCETPTLEALFAGAGRFYVAELGSPDERSGVEHLHEALGLRRVREAYRLEVDPEAGEDQTATRRDDLDQLRRGLRGLAGALPRVRAARTRFPCEGWVYAERLAPLAGGGRLRAIASLAVRLELPGVGGVRRRVECAYDPAAPELLVDPRALDDPRGHATGLAQGLLACVYDGPGEQDLIDIVEILLRLGTSAAMQDYLDRRDFPAAERALTARDLLERRLGELIDYGLVDRLGERFGELERCDPRAWRDPEQISRWARWLESDHATEADPSWSHEASVWVARALLQAVGLEDPADEPCDALATLLSLPSLADLPAGLLDPPAPEEPEALEEPEAPPPSSPAPVRPPTARTPRQPVSLAPPPTPREPPERGPPSPAPSIPERRPTIPLAPVGRTPIETATLPPSEVGRRRIPPAPPGPAQPSAWSRFARWFGFGEEEVPQRPRIQLTARPRWARADANPLEPEPGVPPQLWATRAARREVSERKPPVSLLFQPPTLPRPYLYALHGLGASFDPATQHWSPKGAPAPKRLADTRPSGRSVVFQGRIADGVCQLPVPLFSRPRGEVEVLSGRADALGMVFAEGAGSLRVRARGAATIRYEVELLEAPLLSAAEDEPLPDHGPVLVHPTLSLDDLPGEAAAWVEANREGPAWARALAAQEFVQRRYLYDDGFMERPAVREARRRLGRSGGNHHLTLLHAGADGEHLGRGICYELNTVLLELLRHLGIPSLIATCWVLEGRADRPDHLIALALLPSPDGPVLLPLDASTGPQGSPLRPLGRREPPPAIRPRQRCPFCHDGLDPLVPLSRCEGCGAVFHAECVEEFGGCPALGCSGSAERAASPPPRRIQPEEIVPARPAVPRVRGAWGVPAVQNLPPADAVRARLDGVREEERRRALREADELAQLVRHVCAVRQVPLPELYVQALASRNPPRRREHMRRAASAVLPDARLRAVLLDLLHDRAGPVDHLDEARQRLVREGFAEAVRVPRFELRPSSPGAPPPRK